MPACDHCALPVAEDEAVYADFDGSRKVFCCHACWGIYGLIRSEGLDDFYETRRGWSPGPAEPRSVDTAAFQGGLRPGEGETRPA
ncbi:MAG: heavy metal translocating P-type ATPase metal-binding domain-containing protein, partial [Spirochaetota bacterium]